MSPALVIIMAGTATAVGAGALASTAAHLWPTHHRWMCHFGVHVRSPALPAAVPGWAATQCSACGDNSVATAG